MKEHKLREWERQVRELEEGGAVDGTGFDLCFLCEVKRSVVAPSIYTRSAHYPKLKRERESCVRNA